MDMAGKSDTLEYDVLRLIFNGVAISSLATTGGTTSLWLGLHTADPGDAASTAAEGGYTQYTRVKTDRSSGASTGWAVTSGTSDTDATCTPVANVEFPQNTSTSTGTFTHASVWMSSNASSSGCLYTGTVSPNINWSQNVTPRLTTGSSITED
jgi:hypothetical protein